LTTVWADPWGFSLAAWFQDCCCVPGVSRMNLVKLRSRTGSSVTCLLSKVTATSARSVLRSWPSAEVTVTSSVTPPTSRAKSTLVWVSTFTTARDTTLALNPESSARTEYVPGSKRSLL
jgi:hypothetical protein